MGVDFIPTLRAKHCSPKRPERPHFVFASNGKGCPTSCPSVTIRTQPNYVVPIPRAITKFSPHSVSLPYKAIKIASAKPCLCVCSFGQLRSGYSLATTSMACCLPPYRLFMLWWSFHARTGTIWQLNILHSPLS